MAVESRFVVIRHGVEAKTFMDKKSADEYDKMLDMADNLAEIFASTPVDLTDAITEELSIYLAQHREEVLVALLAKKPTKPVPAKPTQAKTTPVKTATQEPVKVAKKAAAKPKKKVSESSSLSEAS